MPANEILLDRASFYTAVKRAGLIVTAESKNPNYARVRLTLSSGLLSVISSNGDQSFLERISVNNSESFDIQVSCVDLVGVLALTESDLRLEVTDGALWIRSGVSSWSLPVMATVGPFSLEFEFADSAAAFYSVPRQRLLSNIEFVKDAVPLDGMRLALYQVDVRDGSFVACDGLRLHRSIDEELRLSFSLAASGLSSLVRLLKSFDSDVIYVGISKGKVHVVSGGSFFMTQQAAVAFPDTLESSYIGSCLTHDRKFTMPLLEAITAMKHVLIHANQETGAVIVKVSKDGIFFSSTNGKGNTALRTVDVSVSATQSLTLNGNYLMSALKSLALKGYDHVEWSIGDPKKKELVMLSSGSDNVVLSQLSVIGV